MIPPGSIPIHTAMIQSWTSDDDRSTAVPADYQAGDNPEDPCDEEQPADDRDEPGAEEPAVAEGHMKSNRTVTRDLRRQEFKLLFAKEEEKIKAANELNRLVAMFYEKMFGSTS